MFPGRVLLLSAIRKFDKNMKRELDTKRSNPTHANLTYPDYMSSLIKPDDGYGNFRQIIKTRGVVNMQT